MKYDLDCIREVLLTLESNLKITVSENEKGPWGFEHNQLAITDVCKLINPESATKRKFEPDAIAYSVEKLAEAGYISVISDPDFPLSLLKIISITYMGHEFLENIRINKHWEKAQNIGKAVGSFSLSILGEIAKNSVIGLAQAALVNQCSTQNP